jgi:hypothetical protein
MMCTVCTLHNNGLPAPPTHTLTARLLTCPYNWARFAVEPFNVVDLAAVLPYFVQMAVGGDPSTGSVFRVLRLLRVLRILRLAKKWVGSKFGGGSGALKGGCVVLALAFAISSQQAHVLASALHLCLCSLCFKPMNAAQ